MPEGCGPPTTCASSNDVLVGSANSNSHAGGVRSSSQSFHIPWSRTDVVLQLSFVSHSGRMWSSNQRLGLDPLLQSWHQVNRMQAIMNDNLVDTRSRRSVKTFLISQSGVVGKGRAGEKWGNGICSLEMGSKPGAQIWGRTVYYPSPCFPRTLDAVLLIHI